MKQVDLRVWTCGKYRSNINLEPGKLLIIPTGLAVAIPKGFEIQIRPRSGLAAKKI